VGKLTNILKNKKPHDALEIIGPLGNGFPIIKGKDKPILIGGGLGSIPLFAFAEKIKNKKPIFFIGARTKKEILHVTGLKSIGINPIISTDDGSLGQKGTVLSVFNKFLTSNFSVLSSHLLYACGPRTMLRELSLLAEKFKLNGYIALEENMACGIGACLSCVVRTKDGFKRVCKEGPVFPMEEIIW
jgi:dihydroorotate dehydrogenase electron transfer subunit